MNTYLETSDFDFFISKIAKSLYGEYISYSIAKDTLLRRHSCKILDDTITAADNGHITALVSLVTLPHLMSLINDHAVLIQWLENECVLCVLSPWTC